VHYEKGKNLAAFDAIDMRSVLVGLTHTKKLVGHTDQQVRLSKTLITRLPIWRCETRFESRVATSQGLDFGDYWVWVWLI